MPTNKMAAAAATTAPVPALTTRADGSRLLFSWEIPAEFEDHRAISLQIAFNAEFTSGLRSFVLPPALKSVALDVGNGKWFARIGFWKGTATDGRVHWQGSAADLIAVEVKSTKPPIPNPKAFLSIIHVKMIIEGIRFHFADNVKRYIVYEVSDTTAFAASSTRTFYKDVGMLGHMDVKGLTALTVTHVRLATFAALDASVLPTDSVLMLGGWSAALNKRPLKRANDLDGVSTVERIAMEAVMTHADKAVAKGDKPRFSSHADYVRYQAALARVGRSTN